MSTTRIYKRTGLVRVRRIDSGMQSFTVVAIDDHLEGISLNLGDSGYTALLSSEQARYLANELTDAVLRLECRKKEIKP